MAGLTYGPINLKNVVTKEYRSEAVYNGADYIHTAHTLFGTATVHPNLVTDSLQAGGYPTGVDAVAGLQAAFLQPRQDLEFDVGTVPFDALGFDSDAQNGPEPIHFSAVEVYGTKTVICYFGIKWYTVLENDSDPPPITSNRWVMSHQYDERYRLTIVTKGLATFRRDALLTWGTSADDYRSWLFIPVPVGFQRVLGPIVLSQDGLAVDYTLIDKRVIFDSPLDTIAHMAVRSSAVTKTANKLDVITAGISKGLAEIADVTAFRRNPAGVALDILSAGLDLAYAALPRTVLVIEVDAQGTPVATADDLITAAIGVAQARFNDVTTFLAGSVLSVAIDHDNRFCQVHWEFNLAPTDIPELVAINPPNDLTDGVKEFLTTETVLGYQDTLENDIAKAPGQGDPDNLGYVGDDIMVTLVAATLQPAAPDLKTVNPVQAPDVTGTPVLTVPPQGRQE